MASTCLLRVRNELFPLEFNNLDQHSRVRVISEKGAFSLVIDFKSRKNRQQGSTIKRTCTCHHSPEFCPPHVVIKWMQVCKRVPTGRLFHFNYTSFTRELRHFLGILQVEDADKVSSHGFRRGSAEEIFSRGGRLADILVAGDWRSPAFMEYLDRESVEEAAVLQSILDRDDAAPVLQESSFCAPDQPHIKRARVEASAADEDVLAQCGTPPEVFLRALEGTEEEFMAALCGPYV